MTESDRSSVSFDRVTGRRFVRAVKYFLTSEVRWRGLFALLIAFALTINGLNVLNSYVGCDFMTAIVPIATRPGSFGKPSFTSAYSRYRRRS
jgi:hypothetical protein